MSQNFNMFRQSLFKLKIPSHVNRKFSKEGNFGSLKVTLIGAAGRTGQATALLLKACPLIDELAIYDVVPTAGMAMELNQIDTKCNVHSYKKDLKGALLNCQVVAITANAPRIKDIQAGFKQNADIMCGLMSSIAQYSPKALIAIATYPVNSLVPLASEILKHFGVYNPNHVFGITTLEVMRTNSLVARKIGLDPEKVHVPCVGGQAKTTVVPILSQTKPKTEYTDEELLQITQNIQGAQSNLEAEGCAPTYLSGALAIAQFVISLIRGIKGEQNVVETCYIKSKAYPNLEYLSTPILLGSDGVSKNLGLPAMTDYEKCLFQACRECLRDDIQVGEDYAKLKFNLICS